MRKFLITIFVAVFSIISVKCAPSRDVLTVRIIAFEGAAAFSEDVLNVLLINHKDYLADNKIDIDIIKIDWMYIEGPLADFMDDEDEDDEELDDDDEEPLAYPMDDIFRQNFDLIIVMDYIVYEKIKEWALKYPEQKFMVLAGNADINLPNVMEIEFAVHEGSYLVGAAAALKAVESNNESHKFGFMSSFNNYVTGPYKAGFVQGVLSVLPQALFVEYYLYDWETRTSFTSTREMFDLDVFAIYCPDAVNVFGTTQEAFEWLTYHFPYNMIEAFRAARQSREWREKGKDVWVIGADLDYHMSAVLTSMVPNMDVGIIMGIKSIIEDDFSGRSRVLTLADNGMDYTKTNRAVTADIIRELESIKEKIKNGEIIIHDDIENRKVSNGLFFYIPEDGEARDIVTEVIIMGDTSYLDNIIEKRHIEYFSKHDLRLLRNTIFARYGYKFTAPDLKKHFTKFSWYNGNNVNARHKLTGTDWINVALIQSLERATEPKLENDRENLFILDKLFAVDEASAKLKSASIYGEIIAYAMPLFGMHDMFELKGKRDLEIARTEIIDNQFYLEFQEIPHDMLKLWKTYFEEEKREKAFIEGRLQCSDPETKIAIIQFDVGASFASFYYVGSASSWLSDFLGECTLTDHDDFYYYIYSDRDAIIRGVIDDDKVDHKLAYNIPLKKGWNKVREHQINTGKYKVNLTETTTGRGCFALSFKER